MLKPAQVSSDSSLDSTLTHASSIEYSNISADNQRRSADNACNNTGEDPTPVPSFPASLASSQSLLSLSDPLNCFIADLPLDMFQPVPLPTYNMSHAQNQQASPMQSQQQAVSGNVSTNFAMTRNLQQRNQPLGTRGTAPMTIESSKPNPISDEAVAQIVSNSSVPEFLYQLTKMLTDDHRDIIEWSNAKIEVHNPHRLESEVLNKYFRHSKYASFQRQLNYFGFRKLAGKGKMAPCSYVNENATNDLRSLLRMKVSCILDLFSTIHVTAHHILIVL
jgi:Heat shock transcription factor